SSLRSVRGASSSSRAAFFFQAEDGIRDRNVTGVQTCALPIYYNHFLYSEFIHTINFFLNYYKRAIDTSNSINSPPIIKIFKPLFHLQQSFLHLTLDHVYPLLSK